MKQLIIILMLGLILVSGCVKTPYIGFVPPPETHIEDDIPYYEDCRLPAYNLVYVDDIIQENCYAIRTKTHKGYEEYYINNSFKFAHEEDDFNYLDRYFLNERNMRCDEIETEGDLYCLRDNLTCLIIENKICDIINLSEFR